VDGFNLRVATEKSMVAKYNAAVRSLNADVDTFNSELARVGTPASY